MKSIDDEQVISELRAFGIEVAELRKRHDRMRSVLERCEAYFDRKYDGVDALTDAVDKVTLLVEVRGALRRW